MQVSYVNHMGNDLTVVNAARVSFNKRSEWGNVERVVDYGFHPQLSDRDTKLINYLASHGHWTPFAHPQVSLHMKLPMFVQRQIDKHQVGFVTNEVSRRYVDYEPEFYDITEWRLRPENGIKQGSSKETIPYSVSEWNEDCKGLYEYLLEKGVAPEMARMILPMSTYTESWKTGSLYAWANLHKLRASPDAQEETQEVAEQVGKIIQPLFPVSWEALTKEY